MTPGTVLPFLAAALSAMLAAWTAIYRDRRNSPTTVSTLTGAATDLVESIRAELGNTNDRMDNMRVELATMRARIAELEAEVHRLEQQNAQYRNEIRHLEKRKR